MSVAEKTYKTSLINNRRYLGNKYKLLSFIIIAQKEKDCNKNYAQNSKICVQN